jgi:hypothetical protein
LLHIDPDCLRVGAAGEEQGFVGVPGALMALADRVDDLVEVLPATPSGIVTIRLGVAPFSTNFVLCSVNSWSA